MTIWGIADLHLRQAGIASASTSASAERHAGRWRSHTETIAKHWREVVGRDDLVLIPGDVSMARNHRELQPDLVWLDRLPGIKVLGPGNHDRWFNRIEAIRPMLRPSLRAVDGDAIEVNGVIVCGLRGAEVPGDEAPAAKQREADRALAALDRALDQASRLRREGQAVYVLWHYAPFDGFGRPGPWVARFEASGVTACLYGHLHAQSQWALAKQGRVRGVRYHLVAADAIGFRPLRITG